MSEPFNEACVVCTVAYPHDLQFKLWRPYLITHDSSECMFRESYDCTMMRLILIRIQFCGYRAVVWNYWIEFSLDQKYILRSTEILLIQREPVYNRQDVSIHKYNIPMDYYDVLKLLSSQ